jgi:hypothetical protein
MKTLSLQAPESRAGKSGAQNLFRDWIQVAHVCLHVNSPQKGWNVNDGELRGPAEPGDDEIAEANGD